MKKIHLLVKPNSKKNQIERVDKNHLIIRTTAPATKGKANKQVFQILAKYLRCRPWQLFLKKDHKSRHKTIQVAS